jgi:hypothetical protein
MVHSAGRSSWSHPWSERATCSLRAAQDPLGASGPAYPPRPRDLICTDGLRPSRSSTAAPHHTPFPCRCRCDVAALALDERNVIAPDLMARTCPGRGTGHPKGTRMPRPGETPSPGPTSTRPSTSDGSGGCIR